MLIIKGLYDVSPTLVIHPLLTYKYCEVQAKIEVFLMRANSPISLAIS